MSFGGFQAGAFEYDFQTTETIIDPGPTTIAILPPYANRVVPEMSDIYVQTTYFDIFNEPYVPESVLWRVWDDTNKLAVQDWTPIAAPTNSDLIHVSEVCNDLGNSNNLTEVRLVVFWITASGGAQRYDSIFYNVMAVNDVP